MKTDMLLQDNYLIINLAKEIAKTTIYSLDEIYRAIYCEKSIDKVIISAHLSALNGYSRLTVL